MSIQGQLEGWFEKREMRKCEFCGAVTDHVSVRFSPVAVSPFYCMIHQNNVIFRLLPDTQCREKLLQ